jgi:flavin reductase (DIM6/NTAB) family NADH-FMN oxidoreductase RutF
MPVIAGSLAYIEAKISSEIQVTDHTLFVGEVINAEILSDTGPLIYHMRAYKKLG